MAIERIVPSFGSLGGGFNRFAAARPLDGTVIQRSGQAGFAAVEWVVAITFTLVLVALSAQSVQHFVRTGFARLARAEWDQQATLAGSVLAAELGRASTPEDWTVHSGDSVRVRAFRGTGWICGIQPAPNPRVIVVLTGDRLPNPAKDSILIHGAQGQPNVRPLRRRWSGVTCPALPLMPAEAWDVGGVTPTQGLLRFFESGAYSVSRGSLRYRAGRGGRQPVVGSTFDKTSSLSAGPTGGLGGNSVELILREGFGPYRGRGGLYRRVARHRPSLP